MVSLLASGKNLRNWIERDIRRAAQAGVMHIGFSSFLTRLTTLAQRVLLARILGVENIGHIAVISSALNIIRLPAGVGTFTVVNKLVAENTGNRDAQKQVLGTSFWINLMTSVVVCFAAWFILARTDWVSDSVANGLLRVLVIFLPIMIFTEVMSNALMGQHRMKTIAGINSGLALFGIIVIVPMAYIWSLKGWFFNQVIVIVMGFGLMAWNLRRVLSLTWNGGVAKKVMAIGSFAFLGQLVGALITQFDTLSVSKILEDDAITGIYNTAALIALQMIVVPGAILTVVFPFVAQNKGDIPRLKERYWELFRKIGGLAIGLSVVAWLLAPWFFPIFGRKFAASVSPFRVLVLGFVARSLYVLDNTYLDALGRTDITFFSGSFAAVITIGLNLTMIPIWGMMGAAWATTVSMFIGLALRQISVHYFIFKKQAIR